MPLPTWARASFAIARRAASAIPAVPRELQPVWIVLRPMKFKRLTRRSTVIRSRASIRMALAFLAGAAQRYPANDTTVGDGLNTGGFRFNARTPTQLNTYIARFDFNLTNSQTLFVRGNYQNDNVTRAVYAQS